MEKEKKKLLEAQMNAASGKNPDDYEISDKQATKERRRKND